jgi:hypothetical protein
LSLSPGLNEVGCTISLPKSSRIDSESASFIFLSLYLGSCFGLY